MVESNDGKSSEIEAQSLSSEIREFIKQANELNLLVDSATDQLSKRSSSYLVALIGGAIGSLIGIAVSSLAVVSGPVGALVGAALAVLAWRGPEYVQRERKIERTKVALDQIKMCLDGKVAQLKDLPDSAPDELKKQLWGDIMDLNKIYMNHIRNCTYIPSMNTSEVNSLELRSASEIAVEQLRNDNERRLEDDVDQAKQPQLIVNQESE
ncbi:glycine zipper family protein [Leptolyngbya sp. NIES-2104]|uniref:glycine zipper family protein n=1 Tax=Leptolyngbya sp. NIES-2104 TaxID=1552121 RepID=UPI00073F0215|nr:glycine zipper family protein [Leptolyngbya sp. NIES-2104]